MCSPMAFMHNYEDETITMDPSHPPFVRLYPFSRWVIELVRDSTITRQEFMQTLYELRYEGSEVSRLLGFPHPSSETCHDTHNSHHYRPRIE